MRPGQVQQRNTAGANTSAFRDFNLPSNRRVAYSPSLRITTYILGGDVDRDHETVRAFIFKGLVT
jgi:hypothetical protein